MNEKIVELLTKQGFLDSDGDPVTDFKPRHLVDLIETVVRECAEVARDRVSIISTRADAEYVEERIQEHFGVEE